MTRLRTWSSTLACIPFPCSGIVSGYARSVPGIEESNMATTTPKKCANPACSCPAPTKDKYCSAHCEGIADKIEIVCTCGHDGCTHAGMRG